MGWLFTNLLRSLILRPVFERHGTMPGDMYSFGIILHEILQQEGLFYTGPIVEYSVEEKIKFVSCVKNDRIND